MRWMTHTGVAVGVAVTLGAPVGVVAGVAAGSVLPDVIDRAVAGKNQQLWRKIHRGTSHWWGWYVLLTMAALVLGPEVQVTFMDFLSALEILPRDVLRLMGQSPVDGILLGLALGAASHVALDALNPSGVPLWPFDARPRLALGLVSTGTWKEYVLLAVCLLLLGVQYDAVLERLARW